MSAATNVTYGFYGKIPANADFVHRDLPRVFVTPWDQWLRQSLAASRETLGDAWMSAYLHSPPWRFAIDAGLAGPSAWIGLLISSIDHVQRCYPLTVAVALPESLTLVELRFDLDPQLHQLEDIAIALVAGERTIDDAITRIGPIAREIDRRLRSSPPPLLRWPGNRAAASIGEPTAPTVSAMISEFRAGASTSNLSCWWHCGWREHSAARIVAEGLPPMKGFAAFLDGAWTSHGWNAIT